MTVIMLHDKPDKQGRIGRQIDFVCLDCKHIWWKMLRTKIISIPRQECPNCGSKEFAYVEWDYKIINLSKAARKSVSHR